MRTLSGIKAFWSLFLRRWHNAFPIILFYIAQFLLVIGIFGTTYAMVVSCSTTLFQVLSLIHILLNRGGFTSMLSTIGLLMAAGIFGAPLRTAGVVDVLLDFVKKIEMCIRDRKGISPGAGTEKVRLAPKDCCIFSWPSSASICKSSCTALQNPCPSCQSVW